MSVNERTEVLVVGAGPTGLTLAAALARLGVRTRVIDRGAGRTDKSKAIGVQAGSLEALGDFFGDELSDKMVAAGFSAREFFAEFGQRDSLRIDLSQIPSRFNFILVLPQSYTEQFLEDELAKSALAVQWLKELVSLEQNGSTVTARMQDAAGRAEELECDFVVGCDGAHSTVRHQAGIPFAGSAYEGNFVLGDVVLRWPWPYNAGRALISERGIVGCFPMPGEQGAYRLIVAAKGPVETASPDISPDEFCALLARLVETPIEISRFVWLTRFRLHHRIARRFASGRVYLAGDAAHIHSPVGGQGMNTGILEALNLGSKLAAVLRHGAPLAVLDRYEQERLPIARSILRGTDIAFQFALSGNPLVAGVRPMLLPRILGTRWIQRRLATAISQVSAARREIRERHRLLGDLK
jgi:2-polyprenyl-6-methoxyphenol hydroxylase-like FAD-dependent oxidoreductase